MDEIKVEISADTTEFDRAIQTVREWIEDVANTVVAGQVIVGSIDAGARFDQALATADGWRADATFYTGERRRIRLDHAARMERVAERIAEEA